jgi:hypothetical protein
LSAQRIVDWDELYPGRFFKAGLLRPDERRILTVESVALEELEGENGKRAKGILSFREDKLQLPLNKTNGICLKAMFGRVPYEWVGKRFAIFASEWAGEPCIRIWGSPEIDADMIVTVELPRRKPFKMTMHAMKDGRQRAAGRPGPGVTHIGTVSERVQEILKLAKGASDIEQLQDVEANIQGERFSKAEIKLLQNTFATRRSDLAAAQTQETDDDDNVPF